MQMGAVPRQFGNYILIDILPLLQLYIEFFKTFLLYHVLHTKMSYFNGHTFFKNYVFSIPKFTYNY